MSDPEDDLTEFVSLNVEELHLVGDAANRFHPLVAKSAPGPQKGNLNMSADKLYMAAIGPLEANVERLEKAVHEGRASSGQLLEARRTLAFAKMMIVENNRDSRRDEAQFGPNMHPLFKNTSPAGHLGEDSAVKGV